MCITTTNIKIKWKHKISKLELKQGNNTLCVHNNQNIKIKHEISNVFM